MEDLEMEELIAARCRLKNKLRWYQTASFLEKKWSDELKKEGNLTGSIYHAETAKRYERLEKGAINGLNAFDCLCPYILPEINRRDHTK